MRFDRRVVHAASRRRGGGLDFAFETPGHRFGVSEPAPGAVGAEEDAAAAGAKFRFVVDDVDWGQLTDVDALGSAEAERIEARVEDVVSRTVSANRA